jgi:transcriptional regulator with GAF, ATPase, and Fis domain
MTREEFKEKFGIIGRSKEINDIVDVIMQVGKSDISILIFGESGVGKEVFARAIHGFSNRSSKQLVSVNCGAIPEGILESELFGHRKGSFTGAIESRKGYFEIADGGSLFLDEIAELPLTTQVKLLRAIETQEFMKIGAESISKVDIRIIAATNKDLQREVESKRFREDLYFRLKAVTLSIPPLRKRKGDIELLAHYFINNYALHNKIQRPQITGEAIEILKSYNWPGNVRELKNTVETAIALSKDGILTEDSFLGLSAVVEEEYSQRNLPVYLRKTSEDADREILYRALFELKKDIMELKDIVINQGQVIYNYNNKEEEEVRPLNILEKEAIQSALDKTRGSKRTAAKLLNISERTLYRKIKEYDLNV